MFVTHMKKLLEPQYVFEAPSDHFAMETLFKVVIEWSGIWVLNIGAWNINKT